MGVTWVSLGSSGRDPETGWGHMLLFLRVVSFLRVLPNNGQYFNSSRKLAEWSPAIQSHFSREKKQNKDVFSNSLSNHGIAINRLQCSEACMYRHHVFFIGEKKNSKRWEHWFWIYASVTEEEGRKTTISVNFRPWFSGFGFWYRFLVSGFDRFGVPFYFLHLYCSTSIICLQRPSPSEVL